MTARGKIRALAAGLVLLTAGVAGALTGTLDSPLGGDNPGFLPPAVRWAAGLGLTNPSYKLAVDGDPSGEARLVYHGFLYQRLVGALMPEPTYAAAVRVLGCFAFATIVLASWVVWRVLAEETPAPWVAAILVVGAAQAVAGEVLRNARPEGVGTLWVVLGLAALLKLRPPWNFVLAGAALGLLGTTSPIGAVLAGLALLAWLARVLPPENWLVPLLEVGGGCAGAFFTAVAFYPYTLREWILGLMRNSNPVTGYVSYHGLSAWFFNSAGPLFGAIFLLALIPVAMDAVRLRRRLPPMRWAGYLFVLMLFALAALYFARDERNYNLRLLMPVWVVLAGVGAARGLRAGGLRRWLPWMVAGVLAVGGAEVWRQAVLHMAGPSGAPREEFAAALRQIEARGTVALSDGLLVATEPQDTKVSLIGIGMAGTAGTEIATTDFICIQQINPTRLTPPKIAGWEYVWDDYSDTTPRLLGWPVVRRPQGFQVAIYRRMGSKADLHGLRFPAPAAHPPQVK